MNVFSKYNELFNQERSQHAIALLTMVGGFPLLLGALALSDAVITSGGIVRIAGEAVGFAIMGAWIVALVSYYRSAKRRAIDAGRGRNFYLLLLIPYVNLLVALFLLFAKGRKPARNGDDPLAIAGALALVLVLVMPAFISATLNSAREKGATSAAAGLFGLGFHGVAVPYCPMKGHLWDSPYDTMSL